jgi:Tfp pilus assembly protein PilZ
MANPADRRRSARVEVLGRIQGQVVSLDVPVQVREISLGGMSVETPQAFPVGSVNVFMLTLGDGSGIDVAGRIVYSRPSADANRQFFVSGVQFIDRDDSSPATPVDRLVKKVS